MSAALDTKLSAACTRLILDKPFLGALVLRLPLQAADPAWCKTSATDARALYYNPEYIDALSVEQTQFVLAHEALHCALSHFARRQHRNKKRWDVACDLAINPLLIQDGLTPPPGALRLPHFDGMTAEEIYPCLDDNDVDSPMDDHAYDGDDQGKGGGPGSDNGAARPRPLNQTEREQLAVQWRQRMAGAAQQAQQAGKLSDTLARLVDHLLQPQLPWRMLLARYMTVHGRDDYNYSRPSRRAGDAILPSLRSHEINITAIVDTSGSITAEEMTEFVAEVDAVKGQMRARVVLHACDHALTPDGPWIYEPWEECKLPPCLHGGGGTSFLPAFAWIAAQDRAPDVVLYFTDAEGLFPKNEPPYPVLWLVKGRAKVPWGQRIQLN